MTAYTALSIASRGKNVLKNLKKSLAGETDDRYTPAY